jgi:hypothetical protein
MAKRTPGEKPEKTYRVRILAPERDLFRELPLSRMDIGCTGGIRQQPDGAFALEAYVGESVLEEIGRTRCKAEILADAAEELKRAQAQVGQGNRFKGENRTPRGLGKKVRVK